MGGAVGAVGSAVGSVGGLFGNDTQAGVLGVGQYQGQQYDVNKDAFYNNQGLDQQQQQFAQQLAASQGQTAPQMSAASVDPTQQAQFRDAQVGLMNQLQAQSEGRGPSLANMQLQQGTENNIRALMAQGTTGYGGNPALTQRNILQQSQAANQAAAQQSAMNRAQEQLNAQGQLANVAGAGRGADIGLATTNAQMQQQAASQNQQATMAQRQLAAQQQQYYDTGMASLTNQKQQNEQNYEQLRANQAAGVNSVNEDAYKSASTNRGNAVSKLGSAIAGMAHGGMVGYAGGGIADNTNVGPLSRSQDSAYSDQSPLSSKKKAGDAASSDSGEELAGGGDASDFSSMAAMAASKGAVIPGQAKVEGDSEANDTVPILVSPGEIVIPRSISKHALANEDSSQLKDFIAGLREKFTGADLENEHNKQLAAALKQMVKKAG